ncbi:MAG: aminodeoxychorismate/anthranilate synthase component II [Bacteroidia bacterium]|nr:aminodeoxychorismate/anthranilate synthase component II [Bacteroidia bacterium]
MILFVDNYDSFTWNLVNLLPVPESKLVVLRNLDNRLQEISNFSPQGIVLSPGPGKPIEAGYSWLVLQQAIELRIPVLGVCLGHQLLAEFFGAKVIRAKVPMHGKVSQIQHSGDPMFKGIPNIFSAMRYHSLIVSNDNFPSALTITAQTQTNEIMSIRHQSLPLWGVQFHPESILSEYGFNLLQNWIQTL